MLAMGSAPAYAQEPPPAGPSQVPTTTESGRPDLYLDMPYDIGGYEPEIVMTRGREHLADLAADDPVRVELTDLLDSLGAEVDDMVSGYALVSTDELFAFVVALRVDGVEPGTLGAAYLPILLSDLDGPTSTMVEIGGKDVTTITTIGENGEDVELYVYDEGDTIWIVQAPSDVAETTIETLPPPLPTDQAT
jgi:hypothetical protein